MSYVIAICRIIERIVVIVVVIIMLAVAIAVFVGNSKINMFKDWHVLCA